jgi:hypothetical protein
MARAEAQDVPHTAAHHHRRDVSTRNRGSMSQSTELFQIESGMIVLGADTALVGEVYSSSPDTLIVVRRPLPTIALPVSLVEAVVDDVVLLSVPADAADSLGETDSERLSAPDAIPL